MPNWFDPDAIRGDIESSLTLALPAYGFIYENVEATLHPSGSIRLQISWGSTTDQSIYCPDGTLRSISGVLSVWIFSPANKGTSTPLQTAITLRREFLKWSRLGTCGSEVRISSVNGPRSVETVAGSDFHVHVLTATLTAMEQVSYLR